MLDRLEQNGFLKRSFDEGDRRQIRIVLTDRARSLSQQYNEVSDTMSEIYYKGFTEAEIVDFEDKLKRVLNNLTKLDS